MPLSGHFMDREGRVLVHQTGRYQLTLPYNASWWQRAVPSTDFYTTFFPVLSRSDDTSIPFVDFYSSKTKLVIVILIFV